MTIQLTEEQQKVLNTPTTELHRAINPQTHVEYFLLDASKYESLAVELLEEERVMRGIHALSMKNAARRALEVP